MRAAHLVLVLGDQLDPKKGALREALPGVDVIVMAEVAAEAGYVRHNRHKIAFIFSAMRHLRDDLIERGFVVDYYAFEDGKRSLQEAVECALKKGAFSRLRCCEPGEHRLVRDISGWQLSVPVEIVEDDRFLASHAHFTAWTSGRKQLRMEHFYRSMRSTFKILIDAEGKPEGGKWNYDDQNRGGWRNKDSVPTRVQWVHDDVTQDVLQLVERQFPDHPGDLKQFYLGATAAQAERQLQWFIDNGLKRFGRYQDALAEESPWLFHSLISMYLNVGLLDPLKVCREVECAWRENRCGLAAAEGFIRQVLGWREYVRGIYWLAGPSYADLNVLGAQRPLPTWFWTGSSDMRCIDVALRQSLDLGYAHHIQRLMVVGNFALISGLDVKQVCDWYLAVYVDAFEWVELPNTLGMALYADGGLMASKPYAASGKYIQRQGNHCSSCRYSPAKVVGEDACPFNSLYWHFLDRHAEEFIRNPRLALSLKNWQKKSKDEQTAILAWAEVEMERLTS
ncbi:MAG: cryptochrome/photolyase family protein [Halioglobus sp.]|nr:cryptochrome/photolyase family protein [Halioglobus sp.]